MIDKTNRAVEAQQILDNPLFVAAWADARESLVMAIEDGDITEELKRDKYMLALQLLKSVKGNIGNHINTGEIAVIVPEDF